MLSHNLSAITLPKASPSVWCLWCCGDVTPSGTTLLLQVQSLLQNSAPHSLQGQGEYAQVRHIPLLQNFSFKSKTTYKTSSEHMKFFQVYLTEGQIHWISPVWQMCFMSQKQLCPVPYSGLHCRENFHVLWNKSSHFSNFNVWCFAWEVSWGTTVPD